MALVIPLDEATKIVAEAMTDAYERGRQVGKEERAVIEAARRALRTLRDCSRITAGGSDEEIDSLVKAVEALLAAEKGE